MEMYINQCLLEEWAEITFKTFHKHSSIESYLSANLFSMMQFIGKDVEKFKRQKAFSVKIKNSENQIISVAWASIYFISNDVARLRGLYVLPQYRNQTVMQSLIKYIVLTYANKVNKIISFSNKSTVSFHQKIGFLIEKNFQPRPYIYYDKISKQYCADGEELTLMYFICKPSEPIDP